MLKPGQLTGNALEAGSMALAIEQAMVAQGVIDLSEETAEAAENRRKAFIAIATGVVNHLRAQLEITIDPGRIATGLPAAAVTLRGADGDVQ